MKARPRRIAQVLEGRGGQEEKLARAMRELMEREAAFEALNTEVLPSSPPPRLSPIPPSQGASFCLSDYPTFCLYSCLFLCCVYMPPPSPSYFSPLSSALPPLAPAHRARP